MAGLTYGLLAKGRRVHDVRTPAVVVPKNWRCSRMRTSVLHERLRFQLLALESERSVDGLGALLHVRGTGTGWAHPGGI